MSDEFAEWRSMVTGQHRRVSANIVSPEFADIDNGIRRDLMEQFLAVSEVIYNCRLWYMF